MNHRIERARIERALDISPRHLFSRALAPVLLLAVLAVTFAIPATAQDSSLDLPTRIEAGAPDRLEVDAEGSLELELDEAVVQALRHNLSLVVERYSREQSIFAIKEALGLYDFLLTADVTTRSTTRPTVSELEGSQTLTSDDDTWNFGLERALPWGGGVNISFDNTRSETSNPFVQPNPQYQPFFGVGMRVPILRDFGRDVTERNILVARTNSEISREQFRGQVETVIQQVSDTYWALVEARAQLDVSEESLELAKELHEMNRIQVEVGTMAPLEMVQSEVGVATREEEIIRRRQTLEDTEDRLRRLVNLAQGVLWELPIEPVTAAEVEHAPIDVAEAVAEALDRRVDVVQRRLQNENLRLDAQVAENARLPQLDIFATYGLTAVAGTVIDESSNTVLQDTDYFDAVDDLFGGDNSTWSIGINFAMPLENRAAEARRTQAELAVEQGDLLLRDLEDQVLVEVRRAARAVETAAKAIESARVSSKLARKNLEAEQKRYENGLSTSFQVLEIQEDLSQAASREVTAIISYRNALTAYHLATGQLLEVYGVELANEEAEF